MGLGSMPKLTDNTAKLAANQKKIMASTGGSKKITPKGKDKVTAKPKGSWLSRQSDLTKLALGAGAGVLASHIFSKRKRRGSTTIYNAPVYKRYYSY